MEQFIIRLVAAAGIALALTSALAGPAVAEECLGKREIQSQIDAGQLRPLAEAMAAAGVEGKIISAGAEVCKIDGQWQWRVNVMDSNGESKPVTLPAE